MYCRLKTADFGDFTVVMAALFFTALNDFWKQFAGRGNHSKT